MKKNLYYRTVFKRTNTIQEAVLNVFLAFCSWPRLLLEVFTRQNLGERYFSFSTSMFIACILAFLPFVYLEVFRSAGDFFTFILFFSTWYVYLAGFIYMCLQRREEIKRLPSVYDFGRFSLSTGQIHPDLRNLFLIGKSVDLRTFEIWIEPGLFAFIGFLLWGAAQPIGAIIFISSIFYSLSYMAAYRQGDHFIMDKIDEMICNEEMVNAFVEGKESSETRGLASTEGGPPTPIPVVN
ncbi:MAG: hypothetical protein R2822_08630 [Spirosomataceae bacterium]